MFALHKQNILQDSVHEHERLNMVTINALVTGHLVPVPRLCESLPAFHQGLVLGYHEEMLVYVVKKI